MDTALYIGLVVVGLFLAMVNEFIMWKMWPRIFFPDISARRKVTVSTLIVDPLIASVVCPLASDVYFSLDWLQTCDFFFLFFVLAVLLLMYGCSLLMSFKIISTIIPTSQGFPAESSYHQFSTLVCFIVSSLINVTLTWITLSFTIQGARDFNPSESCFPFMVHDKLFFTCMVSYGFQLLFTVMYAHLSSTINRRLKSVCQDSSNALVLQPHLQNSEGNLNHNLLTYGAISLVCLFLSHAFRSAFLLCSCLPFIEMASGLFWTNWLILAKLPSIGLLYYVISKFL